MSNPPTTGSNPTTPNARRENRFVAAEKMILLMPWGGAGGYEARRVRLLDISAHGLGVVDSVQMQPGDEFVVYLQTDGGTTMVLYTVRHCLKLAQGGYKVGAKLAGFVTRGASEDPDRVLTSLLQDKLV